MYEHFILTTGRDIGHTDETGELSALMASYNISMIDSVKGILYYDWNTEEDYYYIDFQRTYDNFMVNISAFIDVQGGPDFRGNGIQSMLTYNQ